MSSRHCIRILIAIFSFISIQITSQAFKGNEKLILSFTYYGVADGLPSNEINDIGQDSLGFVWCATNNGLVRFDGYNFRVYRSDYADTDFFPTNHIRNISDERNGRLFMVAANHILLFDKTDVSVREIGDTTVSLLKPKVVTPLRNGKFMIGGENGGVVYDMSTDSFSDKIECNGVRIKYIRQIYEDSKGNVWIGTWQRGIYVLPAGHNEIIQFRRKEIPLNVTATEFFEDSNGNFFIGTWGDGLFCLRNYITAADNVISWEHPKTDKRHLDWNIIYDLTVDDRNGYVWLGTPGGLRILEIEGDHFTVLDYSNAETGEQEIFHEVKSVFKDRYGNIWMSDYGNGLVLANYSLEGIEELDPRKYGCKFSAVTSIYRQGNILWIGIIGQNFIRYDMSTDMILNDKGLMQKFDENSNAVMSFVPVPEKNLLFLSTRYAGVYMLTLDSSVVTEVKHFDTSEKGVRGSFTNVAVSDSEGNIWVGTNGGLVIVQLMKDGNYVLSVPKSLNEQMGRCSIESVFADSEHNIWVGSANDGLFRFRYDSVSGKIGDCRCYNVGNGLILNNKIQSIFEDSKGQIWVGTNGGGCYIFDGEEDAFSLVPGMDMFPSDQIFAFAEDSSGTLWISTGKGLTRYVPDSKGGNLYNVGADMGLNNLSFIRNAVWSDSSSIIFGGYDGLCILDPKTVRQDTEPPLPSIEDIQILNRSIVSLPEKERMKITEKLPPYCTHISLSHKDVSVSFRFVAPTFRNEDMVKYAYRMEGLEKEWNYAGANQSVVTYSYLKPGTYRFEVAVSNAGGKQFSAPAYIDVSVKPAPWLTVWAKLGYISVIAAILYAIFITVRNRSRLRSALRIEQMEKLKSEEVNNAKLMFFTNITHELFTPITVMSCSIEKLAEKGTDNASLLKILKSNLNRLMRLLQQILEFRKAESSNLRLKVSEMDIVPFVKKMCDENFSPLVVDKNIIMIFSASQKHITGYADPDKLDKILYNLISNAYKYNRPSGKVFVSVSEESLESGRMAVISVKDTGYGIRKDRMGDLFKRFYEGDYRRFNTKGTGIGLSLTKDLVDLHKGTITVNSVEEEGTVFTVRFPLDKDAYSPDQIDIGIVLQQNYVGQDEISGKGESNTDTTSAAPVLLVVEDNEDLRLVMKSVLEPRYHVLLARNGREALEILKNDTVNFIITDYVMPEMGGLELCRKIRADISLSHLPVVMLSAKSAKENKLRAFEAGADVYITKPFEVKLLIAQIDGIIANREKLYSKYRLGSLLESDMLIRTDMDKQFVDKVICLIEDHISDPDFGIEAFNKAMNMSSSTLYRKIKGVTGMSPKEFIRNVRFKYARKLLEEKTTNVADVAYMVGFADAKYFSMSFKKEFGMTPSQYAASLGSEENKIKQS